MTTARRIRVVFPLYFLFLVLVIPACGPKGQLGIKLLRGSAKGSTRVLSKAGRPGPLGVPPRPPFNPKGGVTLGRSSVRSSYPKGGSVFGTSVKVLSGVAAAESMGRSASAIEGYQQERAYLDGLHSRGLDQSDDSIYSIYFKVKRGSWADWFSDPDLFFYVDIEGQGSFLVPQIHWNYAGGPVLDRVLARDVKPGTKIVVRVLDDDSWSDEIWNNILKTRVSISVSPEIQANKYINISGYIGGKIQLLDRNVVIDAPDPVATAEFVVPETGEDFWVADGTLHDDSGNGVGSIQFACVRSARGEWQQHASAAAEWLGTAVFWLVLGSCLLIWFVKQVFAKPGAIPLGSK